MADHFSENEARRIFARAARRQHAVATPDGLSRADLEAIAREVGLDPALVAAEASVERGDLEGETWHGVPVGVRRARQLSVRISDAEWETIVDLLRAEHKTPGVTHQIGRRREWSTPSGHRPFEIRIDERPEGDRVTIRQPSSDKQIGIAMGATFGGIGLFTAILAVTMGGGEGLSVVGGLAMASAFLALGFAAYVLPWLSARATARSAPDVLDGVLDRIDLLSRADEDRPRGRIDLDALGDAFEDGSVRPRGRARS